MLKYFNGSILRSTGYPQIFPEDIHCLMMKTVHYYCPIGQYRTPLGWVDFSVLL